MSTTHVIEVAVAIVALAILALSSWVETTLSVSSRVNVRRLLVERYARFDEQEIERGQRVRAGMLLIELLSAGIVAGLITNVCIANLDDYGLLAGLLISSVVVLTVGRVLPRAAAGPEPDPDATRINRVARALSFSFAPLIRPVQWLTDALMRDKRRTDTLANEPSSQEQSANGQTPLDRERSEGEIEHDEQEMISGVLHLERASARDIMVPRIDIVAVSQDVLVSEAVDVAIQAGHSRIPVYAQNIDEIVGVVYAKDLLRFVNEDHGGVRARALIREAYFVPESKRVDDLLSEMQQAKVHLAVVVDEYGGTSGVVTIEDILEEIVGEIQDEYDLDQPRIEIIGPDEAIADGALNVDDLSDDLDLDWPEPVSGTIGGLIQRRLGRIPAEGEVVEMSGIRLTVMRVERRRVRLVRIQRFKDVPSEPGEQSRSVTADTLSK